MANAVRMFKRCARRQWNGLSPEERELIDCCWKNASSNVGIVTATFQKEVLLWSLVSGDGHKPCRLQKLMSIKSEVDDTPDR